MLWILRANMPADRGDGTCDHSAMQEWLYRASDAQADPTLTQQFADEYGFICRTAFTAADGPQMIANVAKVDFGDVVHLYYVDAEGGRSLGAYRVVGPNRHPQGEIFGAAVPKTRLRTVADSPLRDALRDPGSGYSVDPRVGEFCGWPVVREDHPSPAYARNLFVGRNTLVPR